MIVRQKRLSDKKKNTKKTIKKDYKTKQTIRQKNFSTKKRLKENKAMRQKKTTREKLKDYKIKYRRLNIRKK